MDRKEFILTCGMICLGGSSITLLLQSCGSANYFAANTLIDNRLVVDKSEFVGIVKDKTIHRSFILLKTEKYSFPIAVYRHDENDYSALLIKCTHRGCELNPLGDYLVCPCHGSEFNNRGFVQHPPADKNLQSFKTTTDNEKIYIQL